MYVFRHTPARELSDGYRMEGSRTLTEMSAADFKAATSETPPDWAQGFVFRRADPSRARQWVADGGHHETALYRGWDRAGRERILYARG